MKLEEAEKVKAEIERRAVSVNFLEIRGMALTVYPMKPDIQNMDSQRVMKLQEQMTSLESQASN